MYVFSVRIDEVMFPILCEASVVVLDQPIDDLEDKVVCLKVRNKLELLIKKHSQISGFTLTFKAKFHDDDDKWLHSYVEGKILESKVWKDKKYMLFPEFTRNGVLHYHGLFFDCYQMEVMKCLKWWRRKFGFAKPELELRNVLKWKDYCIKDYGKAGLWTLYSI